MGTCLYRVMQESLGNVARHAHTCWASVCIHGYREGILLVVRDQGVGLPTRLHEESREGLGLVSMRERARLVNGTLSIRSEAGSAWTLVYPAYSVVVPLPDPVGVPFAYPIPKGSKDLADFVSRWIELKRKDRTLKQFFRHWILGKGAEKREPRWSVVRNVLGWVE